MVFRLLNIWLLFPMCAISISTDSLLKNLNNPTYKISDTALVQQLLNKFDSARWVDVRKSISYAEKAYLISKKIEYERGLALSNYSLAVIYSDYDIPLAEEFALEALHHARKINDRSIISKVNILMGVLKIYIEEDEDALEYFSRSLSYYNEHPNDSIAAAIYNNLAISYINQGKDSLAMVNYKKAMQLNRKTGNFRWLATNYQNVGYEYLLAGNTDSSKNYLNKSLELAIQYQHDRLLPTIYLNLGKFYKETGDVTVALSYFRKSLSVAKVQMNRFVEKQVLQLIVEVFENRNNIDSAYHYQQELIVVSESLDKMDRLQEIDRFELKERLKKEQLRMEYDQKLLRATYQRKELVWIIVFILAALVIITLFFLFWMQRVRHRKKSLEQKTLVLERESLKKELDHKRKELTTNVMYLQKKNEFINLISSRLKSVQEKNQNLEVRDLESIIKDLDKSTNKDVWKEFEVRFKEVHTGFYKKLSDDYPSLTPNELRICAFLRLNMTSKEIAALTFQSPDTLKTARYRLRKKLKLTREENLVSFLTRY